MEKKVLHFQDSRNYFPSSGFGERGGSVVECRTPEREVRGSRPTAAVLCPWARHFTPRKYWLITQEAMAPSRYDWKIVDWDVKPQHNQPNSSGFKNLHNVDKKWAFGDKVGIIRNNLLFLWILSMCNLQRVTHKLNIIKIKAIRALLNMWVILRSLHINKIHKNKIHSYNEKMNVLLISGRNFKLNCSGSYICPGFLQVWWRSKLNLVQNIFSIIRLWEKNSALKSR